MCGAGCELNTHSILYAFWFLFFVDQNGCFILSLFYDFFALSRFLLLFGFSCCISLVLFVL